MMNAGNNGITSATAAERIAAAGALDHASRTLSRLRVVRGASKKTKRRIARALVVAAAAAIVLGVPCPRSSGAATPNFSDPWNPFGLTMPDAPSPTLADIDGDGDLDAFFGELYGNLVFFQNTGSASAGAFAPSTTNPFGLSDIGTNSSPSFADIDGDGDLDAFVGEYSGDINFFENTGSASLPSFTFPAANPFGISGTYALSNTSPALGDIDGDGDFDLFIGDSNGNSTFFENTGTSSAPAFAASSTNPFGLADVGSNASANLADIDGDGDLDAFIGDGFYFEFFENTGSATAPAFSSPTTDPFGLSFLRSVGDPLALGDLDGDGDIDALVPSDVDHVFFENTGTSSAPAFESPFLNAFGIGDVGAYASPDLVDIDSDGDIDAFVGALSGDTHFFENTGSASAPSFAAGSINPFGLSDIGSESSPDFADLDADGDLDALIGEASGDFHYFENTGSVSAPAFAPATINPFGLIDLFLSANAAAPEFADIDGDGDFEVFSKKDVVTGFVVFPNTGTASAPAFPGYALADPYGLFANTGSVPTLADLDGDGDLDMFHGQTSGDILLSRNTGSASAPAFVNLFAGGSHYNMALMHSFASPAFADIDGDGDLDLFIGTGTGYTIFQENIPLQDTPTPTATPTATDTPTPGATATPTATSPPGGGPCPATPDTCLDVFQKGLLLVKEKSFGKEKIIAKFIQGPGLAQSTFGNPLGPGGTSYLLCIYGDDDALAGELAVDRAGDNCDGFKPCWKSLGGDPPTGKGFFYKDKNVASDGVKIIKLKGGSGSGTLLVKAANNQFKGQVAMPTGIAAALAGDTSATIQIQSSDAQCFSAGLTNITKAETLLFKGKK